MVLVGENPASKVYVTNKGEQTKESGMNSFEHKLPDTTSQAELLALVDRLNDDPAVNGILVQLPLPKQIDPQAVLDAIDPDKDVDGFHVVNAGRLATGGQGLVPCTPLGCLLLLKDRLGDLAGKRAVVVGRSNIVGKPMAQLLLDENCTVTIAHSRTRDLAGECRARRHPRRRRRQGRRWCAAIGSSPAPPSSTSASTASTPATARPGWSATSPMPRPCQHAGAITPVPGGVGPMTIACLLQNTLTAACRQRGIAVP